MVCIEVDMIKRQYDKSIRHRGSKHRYFLNFLDSCDANKEDMWDVLIEYKATKGRSKRRYCHNVKWHDHELYTIFVLRYS